MLTSLRIENFAIVSLLELDFNNGMNAFTGETGAGKSIMIDALMLVLGERADALVVRKDTDKCDISAQFQIDEASAPALWLTAHDISHDNEIFLRRVITKEGRSKSYINGQPFPLQKVKELSEMLVHIHGQHQHQTLLHHPTHRQHVDDYANHDDLLNDVESLYREYHRTKQQLEIVQSQRLSNEQLHLLQYQIEELTSLAPIEGEMDRLHEEHQTLHHACTYLEHTQRIEHLLHGDDEPNIFRQLNQITQLISLFPQTNTHIKNASELFNSAMIMCDEAFDELSTFSSHVHMNPERLSQVEARMSALHQTARKFHVDVNQLPTHLNDLCSQMNTLHAAKDSEAQLQETLMALEAQYQCKALALRESRKKAAHLLAQDITTTIQQLGMPKGKIHIELTPLDKIHPHGLDKIEYQVCTNPGMPMDALNKVASGGELSRISLAIQMITAQRASTPTLLFDEVDVGIGGATAALVGQLLRTLGERLQVFCVTHQPQVAAYAHHHFMVEKHTQNEQTFSKVTSLNHAEKIDEIARMLGGLVITEQTRSHAQELLAHSECA